MSLVFLKTRFGFHNFYSIYSRKEGLLFEETIALCRTQGCVLLYNFFKKLNFENMKLVLPTKIVKAILFTHPKLISFHFYFLLLIRGNNLEDTFLITK